MLTSTRRRLRAGLRRRAAAARGHVSRRLKAKGARPREEKYQGGSRVCHRAPSRVATLGRTETDGHSVSYRLGTARRERRLSDAVIVLKFGSSVLGTGADPSRSRLTIMPLAMAPCTRQWPQVAFGLRRTAAQRSRGRCRCP